MFYRGAFQEEAEARGGRELLETGQVVGLVEDTNGGAWLSRMIGPIHELMAAQK